MAKQKIGSRGPATRHARERAGQRPMNPLSPQRQQDILNRLKKGAGLSLAQGRRDAGRYYLEDNGDQLVVVVTPAKDRIITLWPLEPGTRAWKMVEAHLAPQREAAKRAEQEARAAQEAAAKAAQLAEKQRERDEIRRLMTRELTVPPALARAKAKRGMAR